MKVLVAEDESITRELLGVHLGKWGYDPILCDDGNEAWRLLQGDDPPRLVLLDWMMPGMDGPAVCRNIRDFVKAPYIYTILLTHKNSKEDIVAGLNSGADDYVIKPFDPHELRLRISVGSRIIELESKLTAATARLETANAQLVDALDRVKKLSGLLPICCSCKKIRTDRGDWQEIEQYIRERSEADFTHGLCTECSKKLYPEFYGD
jgi:phosphoserine phosphatase RsbU/P